MNTERTFIHFHRPSIGEDEIQEVISVLRSGWLTSGPRTVQFEKEFREYVQAPHSLAVNSCTAGLHLAAIELGIGPGDEVITTPMTFCASVNILLHVGATPVLADIGPDGNIDPEVIEKRITSRTKAILPVHLAGLPCNMDRIWELARTHGLYVIEDAAHATGTHYRDFPIGAGNPATGSRSDAVAFSFYATKNLTTGEGGMVTTHDPEVHARMQIRCLHGISKDAWNRYSENGSWFYQVLNAGFKYNLSDLQSAMGIHQLRRQEEFVQTRTEYAAIYNEIFAPMEEVEIPSAATHGRHSWHLYILRLKLDQLDIDRGQLIKELHQLGIGTSIHFIPIPLHPAYEEIAARPENQCPHALDLYSKIISLPLYPAMSPEDVRFVGESVRETLRRSRKKVTAAALHAL
jgi:dTDP-4-amino-4,6-dideoxygalactose transaminase